MRIETVRRTLFALAATAALITAVATAAPASSAAASKLPAGSALSIANAASAPTEEMVSGLIVKSRVQASNKLAHALNARDASGLSHTANVALRVFRPMSGGAHVVRFDQPLTLSEARVVAERLMHNDYSVEFAEPDRTMHIASTTPTDIGYSSQWHYFAPTGANKGGANLPNAWDITKGSASINVAVLDTGYIQHVDLGTVLPGYDFVSSTATSIGGERDGSGGRDADARDPGTYGTASECNASVAQNSNWHGTHVAGTIAALMNNGIGGTGIAPNVKILPVRTLGKCGSGTLSDIIDGMRWAAGLAVTGVPANPGGNVAHVLNMSIGGTGACPVSMQSAVTEIVNAGKVIVAAAGNGAPYTVTSPANCTGVIAVTAHAIDGDNAGYAAVGTQVAISAPGGGCGTQSGATCTAYVTANGPGIYSTLNTGTAGPVADNWVNNYQGTSMATPHVAGVVALMLSLNRGLSPAQVKSYLQSSARPHPAGSTCTLASYAGMCGAGLLDAELALSAFNTAAPTASITNPPAVVAAGTNVALTGSGTAVAGRAISAYAWTQISGPSASVISNGNTASASFTASTSGSYLFRLTVTDSAGQTGFVNSSTVRVNTLPVLAAIPTQTVTVGAPLTFAVTATDADGDPIIFHSVTLPAGATLSAAGVFSWPSATPVGATTMTYYSSDNDGNSATGTVNITVAPAPAPATSSGGGGGSLDGESLIGLAFLAAWLRLRRKSAPP